MVSSMHSFTHSSVLCLFAPCKMLQCFDWSIQPIFSSARPKRFHPLQAVHMLGLKHHISRATTPLTEYIEFIQTLKHCTLTGANMNLPQGNYIQRKQQTASRCDTMLQCPPSYPHACFCNNGGSMWSNRSSPRCFDLLTSWSLFARSCPTFLRNWIEGHGGEKVAWHCEPILSKVLNFRVVLFPTSKFSCSSRIAENWG